MMYRPWSDGETRFLEAHYGEVSPAELAPAMARALGAPARGARAVACKAQRLGLCLPPPQPADAEVRRLHAEGLTDAEAARRLGVSRPTVCRRRKALGLPPNAGNPAVRRRLADARDAAARAKEYAGYGDYLSARRRMLRLAQWPYCTTRAQVTVCRALHSRGPMRPAALALAVRGEVTFASACRAVGQLLGLRVLVLAGGVLSLGRRGAI